MSNPLTDAHLAAIRRRLERITEPPWEYEQPYVGWDVYSIPRRGRRDQVADPSHPDHYEYIASNLPSTYDGAFIANAPDDVRALLADLEAWRAVGKALARLEYTLPVDTDGLHYCSWCQWSEEGAHAKHERSCPLHVIQSLLGK